MRFWLKGQVLAIRFRHDDNESQETANSFGVPAGVKMGAAEKIEMELAKHVEDSFWLDLAYDEERRDILTQHHLDLLPDDDEKRIVPELPVNDNHSEWFEHYKKTKLIRVKDGLDLDETSRDYAENLTQKQSADFKNLSKKAKNRRENLDTITWRCCSAIDRLNRYYSNGGSEKPIWATLLTLYHSELCASASDEVSFGWARRSRHVIKDEALYKNVFQWTAYHNVARGFNHLGQPLTALRGLDQWVDEFASKFIARGHDITKEVPHIPEMTFYRLLYFPMVQTLAQALWDLGRYSEQRFYLDRAIKKAKELKSSYWISVLEIRFALATIDSQSRSSLKSISDLDKIRKLPPRVQELAHLARTLSFEGNLGLGLQEWKLSCEWLIGWHSAETERLRPRIKATAGFLQHSLGNPKVMDSRLAFELLISMKDAITNLRTEEYGSLGYLIENSESVPPEPDRLWLWETGERLYRCLKEVLKIVDGGGREANWAGTDLGHIRKWKEALKSLLSRKEPEPAISSSVSSYSHSNSDSIFRQFRPAIHEIELWPKQPLRQRCLRSPNNEECMNDCARDVYRGKLPVEADEDNDKQEGREDRTHLVYRNGLRERLASVDAYRETMRIQQLRFFEYLGSRTGRKKGFRSGEPAHHMPDFELVSLRRWNSFSPNLGSRTAATVGGGYLVRVWSEEVSRYVGVGCHNK